MSAFRTDLLRRRSIVSAGMTLAVLAGACSSADETVAPPPTDGAAMVDVATESTEPDQSPALTALVQVLDVPSTGPVEATAMRRFDVTSFLTQDDRSVRRAHAPALDAGQDPSEAIVLRDHAISPAGVIYLAMGVEGEPGVVSAVTHDGERTELGSGEAVAVSPDGSLLVVGDTDGLRWHAIDGTVDATPAGRVDGLSVASVDVAPDGSSVVMEDAARPGRLVTARLDDGAAIVDIAEPSRGTYSRPRWTAPGEVAALHRIDDQASLAIIEVESGRTVRNVPIPEDAIDADLDISGEWVVYVTPDGMLRWFGQGLRGTLAEHGFVSARW